MMTMEMEITLSMIDAEGSIEAAIEAACKTYEYHDYCSGVVGPSFATSGPGAGWTQQFGPEDYAERALDDEFGALGYIDSSDGRLASLEDGEIVWSDETIVNVVDDHEEVSEDTLRILEEAVEFGHVISDVSTRCTCSSCECDELATHYDSDAGARVCAECQDYIHRKGE